MIMEILCSLIMKMDSSSIEKKESEDNKMACYRNSGCGPYEDRPCNECPASKPEYLNRYNITKENSIKEKDATPIYRISILPDPKIFNNTPMYFWCILKQNGNTDTNCGHGWSESISKAAEDANKYYQAFL